MVAGKISVKASGARCMTAGTNRACPDVLDEGDVLVLFGAGGARIEDAGGGRALVADVAGDCSNAPANAGRPMGQTTLVQAKGRAPLTWAGGTMRAYLDVDATLSPKLYMGRLSGTAKVAEHVHESSWEVLGDVKSSGTLLLDGTPVRVNAGDVVFIPPNTKHAWTPDPGQELVAVQLYFPPGPEQRFKALAAKEAGQDAGAGSK